MGKINPLIFKAYDIRGIYPSDIDEEGAFLIGRGFGTYISKFNKRDVLIGYDNRLSSPSLCEALIRGITSTGANVINIGLVTTPMYYYARYHLNVWSGLMITASHNPSDYNGFKISFTEEGNAVGDEIKALYDFIIKGEFNDGNGTVKNYNIKDEYISLIQSSLNFGNKKIKVVVDCGNGTTGIVIDEILKSLPIEYELLYAESDSTFPNHHPDPSVPENLKDLQEKVLELNYDLGLAFDADGDRIGIVDNLGNVISSDLYMLIMYRFLQNKLTNKTALYDVKCSRSLMDDLDKLGYKQIMNRTGNSYFYRKVHEENIEFGGEYSGHIFFKDKFPGFDDGIYAGLRMVEVLSVTGKTISELLEGMNKYYSTPEIKVSVSEENKFLVMNEIKEVLKSKNYHINETDGVRIETKDYWLLIRVSNTSPYLTVRFEANNESLLNEIQKEYLTLIDEIINKEDK